MDLNAEYRTLVRRSQNQTSPLDSCARRRNPARRIAFSDATLDSWRRKMGRGILLWLLGVPIPIIILLWLFFGR
jgi:hypothetical protein